LINKYVAGVATYKLDQGWCADCYNTANPF